MNEINVEQLKKEIKEELIKNEVLMGLEEEQEVIIPNLLRALKNRWKLVFFITLIAAIASVVYSLSLPNYYKSSALVFIESNNKAALSGYSSAADYSNGNLLFTSLKSEATTNYIINKFGVATNPAILGNVANNERTVIYDELLKTMGKTISLSFDKSSNIIYMSAETMSASLSADIVNAYIDKLSDLISEPKKENLIFIKKQLDKSLHELNSCEDNYKKFVEDNNITSLDLASNTVLLRLELNKLNRELSSKEKLFKAINEQYEIAKISASDEVSQYKVIDKPRIALLKSKPSRSIIVITSTILGLLFAICLSLYLEFTKPKE